MEENKTIEQLIKENEALKKVIDDQNKKMQYVMNQVQEFNASVTYRRLDYLFEILKNKSCFKNPDIDRATTEIMSMMFGSEDTNVETPEGK